MCDHEHDGTNIFKYKEDLSWKQKMIKKVLRAYHEPLLNLHFFGPYLKSNSAS